MTAAEIEAADRVIAAQEAYDRALRRASQAEIDRAWRRLDAAWDQLEQVADEEK